MKYIIREVPTEQADFSRVFRGDPFDAKVGDYSHTIYIVRDDGIDGYTSGLNIEAFSMIKEKAEGILKGFYDVEDGMIDDSGKKYTYQQIMAKNNVPNNSRVCHALKEWARRIDDWTVNAEEIAEFLTITTGMPWNSIGVCGHGDYVEVVYCKPFYRAGDENPGEILGEIYMGCAKEFLIILVNDNGEETTVSFGDLVIADCEAATDDEYKRQVCKKIGIDHAEAELQMINYCNCDDEYSYRIV